MSAAPIASFSFRDVLRIKTMRRIWYAQIVSIFGDFLALFAVISIVSFRMQGTADQITGVQIWYLLPMALLGPIAGVFVDRWPLKRTLVSSDLLRALLILLLLKAQTLWQIDAILMGVSIVSTFFAPAQTVTIRSHVPREGLLSANALMQQAFYIMRVVGPALAGILVGFFGANFCYVVDSISFLLSASLILSVTIRRSENAVPPTGKAPAGQMRRIWHEMWEGSRFIFGHPAISFVVLAMASGMFTLGCFGPLIAIYVRENLHANAQTFGVVSGMIGIGILVGSNAINKAARRFSNNKLVFGGLGGIAVGVLSLAAAPLLAVALGGAFIIGFAVAAIIIPAQTLIQQETPMELMGRVSSTMMSIILASQLLGLLLSGLLAELTGVRQVFAMCAGLLVLQILVGNAFLRRKKLASAKL